MSGSERDEDLLDFIVESIDLVDEYRLHSGSMAEEAALRRLKNLSDGAGELSSQVRDRHPEIPWPKVVGFRNVLAHGYQNVQRSLVDSIVEDDLPTLKAAAEAERRRLRRR